MKASFQKWSVFAGKSMLWALLLYVVMMLVFNWDDVSAGMSGKNTPTAIENPNPGYPGPAVFGHAAARHAGVIRRLITALSGVVKVAADL